MGWILLVLVVVVVFAAIGIYNRLVQLRNAVDGAWADIDVQLKRRHNLVANLVETVKGYASHEKETLERVIQARNQAVAAGGAAETGAAESMLTGMLRQVFALSEAYPDLKANQSFQDLQRSLGELEDAIQNARRYYNAIVRDFNTRIQSFPDVFLAGLAGFTKREYFELTDEAQRAVPKVDFGSEDR